jgi:predicted enzyme related to lactoylglutathione lyase
MNTIGYFEIQSDDPEKASLFYQHVFGWKCLRELNMPIEYFRIDGAGMNGAILKRPTHTPPPECGTNAFTNSIQVADFDDIAMKIIENGGQVALPKFPVLGKCWQGYFMDGDQNVFGIFQVDPKAGTSL